MLEVAAAGTHTPTCSHVGVRTCIEAFNNMCTNIHIYIYIYNCVCIHIHICVHVYRYVYVYYTYADRHVYIHMYMYIHIHIHVYMYMYIYICMYSFIYLIECFGAKSFVCWRGLKGPLARRIYLGFLGLQALQSWLMLCACELSCAMRFSGSALCAREGEMYTHICIHIYNMYIYISLMPTICTYVFVCCDLQTTSSHRSLVIAGLTWLCSWVLRDYLLLQLLQRLVSCRLHLILRQGYPLLCLVRFLGSPKLTQ